MFDFVYRFIIKQLIVALCKEYNIEIPDIRFKKLKDGTKARHNMYKSGIREIVIDLDQVNGIFDAINTARHEFRHVWQTYKLSTEVLIWWNTFESIDRWHYLNSALEIDARLFEKGAQEASQANILGKKMILDPQQYDTEEILAYCVGLANFYNVGILQI